MSYVFVFGSEFLLILHLGNSSAPQLQCVSDARFSTTCRALILPLCPKMDSSGFYCLLNEIKHAPAFKALPTLAWLCLCTRRSVHPRVSPSPGPDPPLHHLCQILLGHLHSSDGFFSNPKPASLLMWLRLHLLPQVNCYYGPFF